MIDFRPGQVFGLLLRTTPFILLRLAIYLGITVAYIIAVGVGGGIGLLFGKVGGNGPAGAGWGAFGGVAIVSGLLFWSREYLLYMVKAGHIAVLVELMDGREVPGGKGQIDYATKIVRERFAASSMLFGLNQLIRGILSAFNKVTVSLASWLPIPGIESVVRIFDLIVNTSLSHLDQVVLAQILRTRSTNPWATARDSVVMYAQNYKGVLKNAAFLTPIIWVLTALIFVIVFGPIAALVGVFHMQAGIWIFALAAITALSLKAALIDPFAMTALLQVYDGVTAGQTPNQEWIGKLEGMSGKFRELTQQASNATPSPAPGR